MFEVSKGDIFLEPLESLIEVLIRGGLKALFRSFPSGPVDQWGWPQWLWLLVVLIVLSLISRAIWRLWRGGNE
jgi:hypothetical protein